LLVAGRLCQLCDLRDLSAPCGGSVSAASSNVSIASCHGSETILIVEDQESIRLLTKSFLEQQGYTVLAAGNGLEALSVIDGYSGPIHLLLSDVAMPGIRGTEVAGRLLSSRPNTQVLYVSGYSQDEIVDPAAAFLQKPYRMEELGAKIRKILDNAHASAA
jgi:two-component system, cell cycle sensor histidine kinase and response regulator CckA